MNSFLKLGVCGIAMRRHYGNETYYLSDEVDAAVAAKDARIKELQENETAYEKALGQRTYKEVADDLARLREENETLRTAGASDFERANKLQSENDLLRRAVEWCLTHGAKRAHIWDEDADGGTGGLVEGIRDAGCDCCSHKLEVPAEFAEIIKTTAGGDGTC